MENGTCAGRCHRARRRRAAAAVAAVLATGVLSAACGGSHPAGPRAGSPPNLALAMASYVHCMHRHGQPGLYVTHPPGGPPPAGALMIFHGFAVEGASPGSPRFQAAQAACQSLLPHGTPPTAAELHQQFMQSLKTARCMRAHGYPGWPDPQVVNGRVPSFLPSNIGTGSPLYRSAAKKCGAPIPPPGG